MAPRPGRKKSQEEKTKKKDWWKKERMRHRKKMNIGDRMVVTRVMTRVMVGAGRRPLFLTNRGANRGANRRKRNDG